METQDELMDDTELHTSPLLDHITPKIGPKGPSLIVEIELLLLLVDIYLENWKQEKEK